MKKIEVKNVDTLQISVESYDICYNRRQFNRLDEPGDIVELIFNDTRELDHLLYVLLDVKKRLDVIHPHFNNPNPLEQSILGGFDIELLRKHYGLE